MNKLQGDQKSSNCMQIVCARMCIFMERGSIILSDSRNIPQCSRTVTVGSEINTAFFRTQEEKS